MQNSNTVESIAIPCGLTMFTGKAGSGKTSVVNSIKFEPINEIYHKHIPYTLGSLCEQLTPAQIKAGVIPDAMKVASLIMNDVKETTSIIEIRKMLKTQSHSNLTSHIYTEQPEMRSSADITGFMMIKGGDFVWSIVKDEETVEIKDIFTAILVLGIFGVVKLSSATPTFIKIKGYPDVLLKGGLSALYLDSLALLNLHAVELGASIVAEVRDDFDDEGQKLKSSSRVYINLEDFTITAKRFRRIYQSSFTDADFDRMIFKIQRVATNLQDEFNNDSSRQHFLGSENKVMSGFNREIM